MASVLLSGCSLFGKKPVANQPASTPPPKPVNLINTTDRPFVTLQPLTARNDIQLVIHDLKKPADEVEVTLEYDRNKGVLDAVLRHFTLSKVPYTDKLFLGSESAGGHVTYHEDVIGGLLRLEFAGETEYALEVPWRYDDTAKTYSQLSTADAKFQVTLKDPIKQSKVIVMQSPGLPKNVDGTVLAGPYLIRTVGSLPKTTAQVSIRLPEESQTAKMNGWDGTKWTALETKIEGKTVSTNSPLYDVYIVTQ